MQSDHDLSMFDDDVPLSDDWVGANYTNDQLKEALAYLDAQERMIEIQQEQALNVVYAYQSLAHQSAEAGAEAKHGNITVANTDFTSDE